MESIFDKYLRELINLTPIKILPTKNKKIISSSIFIPEEPTVKDKTFAYYTGLIKSIEVFSQRMPKEWIYRLYIDELFVSGFKFKPDKTIEKSIYNSISSNSNSEVVSQRKRIKRKLRSGKDNLKKIQYLLFLFIQKIIESRDPKYKNIELISFRSDLATETQKYPGHSSTFGSIIRLFPLFDSDVDLFVSVNCRYPINKLLWQIINEYEQDSDKKLLAFKYDTSFLRNKTYETLYEPFYDIKNQDSSLKPKQTHFIECIDQMLELRQEIIGKNLGLTFESLGIVDRDKHIKRQMFGLDPIIYFLKRKRRPNYKFRESLNQSLGAGLFGMKKDRMFSKRIEVFANFLKYLILSKNSFTFGIDEIILKFILAPEVITMDLDLVDDDVYQIKYMGETLQPIKYIYNLLLNDFMELKVHHLIDRKTSYLVDREHKNIILRSYLGEVVDPDKILYNKETLTDFILDTGLGSEINGDLADIQFYEARSLFVNHKTEEIKDGEKIFRLFNKFQYKTFQDLDFNIYYLFSSFDEFKKLFIFDSKKKQESLSVLNNFTEIDKYYVFKDIQSYKLDEMGKLLEEIIEHYSGLIEPDLLEVKLELEGREYKKIILVGPSGKTKKKKPKKPRKKTQIRKKSK